MTSNTQIHEDTYIQKHKKDAVTTKQNLEETHKFFYNLFYCFFMPFVCRVKPVLNEDVYDIDSHDRCTVITKKTQEGGGPKDD
ncbi:MAG: hypothetical protein EZS28_027506, partial [Streblomastix strix]